MAPGESQAWSCEASGWASTSFLVRFLYAFRALSMISSKLDDETAVR
jgi:hypothetical protein